MSSSERLLRPRFVPLDETRHPPDGVVVYEAQDPGRAVDEAIAAGTPAPYGAVLWDSAVALAQQLVHQPWLGRRVLELGCGCGLVGLDCARQGAQVLCTDVDPQTLRAVAMGADELGVVVETALFDFTGDEPLPLVAGEVATDVVLADVLYEDHLAVAAAATTVRALGMGARVFIGDPERAGRATLVKRLREACIDVVFVGAVAVIEPVAKPPSGPHA